VQELIRLTPYEPKYDIALADFTLNNEQVRFTAFPVEVLEEAIQHVDRFPVVIVRDDMPVGFFVLHRHSEYAAAIQSPDAILIRALSVSSEHQGKGYALAAMKALPAFVHQFHPMMNAIILAVNEQNIPAQRLYLKAGYTDTGARFMGTHGMQFIYRFKPGSGNEGE